MTIPPSSIRAPSLRLWPGIATVALQWIARFAVPALVPGAVAFAAFGGLFGGLAVLLWWAFFSRAPRFERWLAALLMIGGLLATSRLLHVSLATGAMGMVFPIYAVPVVSLAFVAWAVATRRVSSDRLRRATMAATILCACGAWTLLRTEGTTGSFEWDFQWRWSPTAEERLLARAAEERPAAVVPSAAAEARNREALSARPDPAAQGVTPDRAALPAPRPPVRSRGEAPGSSAADTGRAADDGMEQGWPGFRGSNRDGSVRGVRIATDWAASPPVEMWRRAVGPGWSSFAVRGSLLYTQEQRGDEEVVAAYRLSTGEPVWKHRDRVRFWEANAGAGPRATPAIGGNRVYALGATGILNALDAASGSLLWTQNVASDTGAALPDWGFAGSPLVVDDTVIVAAAGQLVAYDGATGRRRWLGEAKGGSYSSPHFLTIDGVAQVLLASRAGLVSVSPTDGRTLWEHEWSGGAFLQPAGTTDGLLFSASDGPGGLGTRRLAVAQRSDGWSVEERWTSIGLKPYFNDFVVHGDHAYGFDGRILACINLATGARAWKGGRYGHGQLLLLADQDVLLVLSEEGDLALVRAAADGFTELARLPAIEGKTWNHPVVVGDVLLVRNDREMAAFRLPPPRSR